MSKAYGMAGLRVGWVACRDAALLSNIVRVKHYTTICNSGPSEILSLIALRNSEIILSRNNKIVSDNLQLLDDFFAEYSGLFSWVRPQGGCVGFVKYTPPTSAATGIDSFCEELVSEEGVLLLPASVYESSTNHFRIGFGRLNMPESLLKFRNFIEKKFPSSVLVSTVTGI